MIMNMYAKLMISCLGEKRKNKNDEKIVQKKKRMIDQKIRNRIRSRVGQKKFLVRTKVLARSEIPKIIPENQSSGPSIY